MIKALPTALSALALLASATFARAACGIHDYMTVYADCSSATPPADCLPRVIAMKQECKRLSDALPPPDREKEARMAGFQPVGDILVPPSKAPSAVHETAAIPLRDLNPFALGIGMLEGVQKELEASQTVASGELPKAAVADRPDGGKAMVNAKNFVEDVYSPHTNGTHPAADSPAANTKPPQETSMAVPAQYRQPVIAQALATGEYKIVTDNARQYLKEGGGPAATKAIEQVLARDKTNPDALGLRAYQRAGEGKFDEALKDANAALARDPDNEMAQRIRAFAESTKHHIGGKPLPSLDFGAKTEMGLGAGSFAGASHGQAVPSAGGGVVEGPLVVQARLRVREAVESYRMGDLSGALLLATRASILNPKDREALVLRARISNGLKNPKAAKESADAALLLKPDDAAALFERGYAELQLGDAAAAQADIDRGLALDPKNGLGHLYRAMCLEQLARKDDAVTEYRVASAYDAALKPLADDALTRLLGGGSASVSPTPLTAPAASSNRLWLLCLGAALVLVFAGVKRLFRRAPVEETPVLR